MAEFAYPKTPRQERCFALIGPIEASRFNLQIVGAGFALCSGREQQLHLSVVQMVFVRVARFRMLRTRHGDGVQVHARKNALTSRAST